jgi:hypothetical protein
MKTFVKLFFSSEGAGPLDVVEDLRNMGFSTEVGDYDFSISWDTPDQYVSIMRTLHNTLAGTRVRYTLMSAS